MRRRAHRQPTSGRWGRRRRRGPRAWTSITSRDHPLGAHLEGAAQGAEAAGGAVVVEARRDRPGRSGSRSARPGCAELRHRSGRGRRACAGVVRRRRARDCRAPSPGASAAVPRRLAGGEDAARRGRARRGRGRGCDARSTRPSAAVPRRRRPSPRVSAQSASPPRNRQAMSSQTWTATGGRGRVCEESDRSRRRRRPRRAARCSRRQAWFRAPGLIQPTRPWMAWRTGRR